jgi:EXS family
MRRKDSNLLSFFAGTLLTSTLITIAALLVPGTPGKNKIDWQEILFTMPIFRFFFMLILALALISLDVYILRKYRVNYMFIFGLDPNYKVTHI